MGLTLKNKPHLSVPRAMACDHNMGIPRLLAQHPHFTNNHVVKRHLSTPLAENFENHPLGPTNLFKHINSISGSSSTSL
jgi:hypothetical protein